MKNLTHSIIILFLPLISIAQNCNNPIRQQTIEGANVELSMTIKDLWWNGDDGRYFFPKNESNKVSAIFAGAFWLTGFTEDGDYCLARQDYGLSSGLTDYWAGPTGLAEDCINWDKHFIVHTADIIASIALFESGQLTPDKIPENLKKWPAVGNPFFEVENGFILPPEPNGFAEFIDTDGDGLYNPLQGDIPKMNGASTIAFWIMNDFGNIHTSSGGDALNFQIQVTAHVFNSGIEAVDNSSVYKLKIINKGSSLKKNCTFGLWMDNDLGCFDDDYAGCLPSENLAFVYNSDALDGDKSGACTGGVKTYGDDIPVIGVKLLDLENENQDSNNYLSYLIDASNDTTPGFKKLYNYMRVDLLPDSIIDNDIHLPFAFVGNPSDSSANSMCKAQPKNIDIRTVNTYGTYDLDPGEAHEIAFSITGIESATYPCPDISSLVQATNLVNDYMVEQEFSTTSISNNSSVKGIIEIFPNPIDHKENLNIRVKNQANKLVSFQVFNLEGNLLKERRELNSASIEVPIFDLKSGMYFIMVEDSKDRITVEKFVVF